MAGAAADAGRALRKAVPRSSHATWEPGRDRTPLAVLEATNRRRVPELARFAGMRALEVWYSRVDGPPSPPWPPAGAEEC
jgi:hypothetical protein